MSLYKDKIFPKILKYKKILLFIFLIESIVLLSKSFIEREISFFIVDIFLLKIQLTPFIIFTFLYIFILLILFVLTIYEIYRTFLKTYKKIEEKEEITEREKEIIDNFFAKYEQKAKYKIFKWLCIEFWIEKEIKNKLLKENNFIDPKDFDKRELSKISLDKKGVKEYLIKYAKNKYNKDLNSDEYKDRFKYDALRDIIKEKVYYEILEILEPYVPEDKKDLLEKRKKNVEKFII